MWGSIWGGKGKERSQANCSETGSLGGLLISSAPLNSDPDYSFNLGALLEGGGGFEQDKNRKTNGTRGGRDGFTDADPPPSKTMGGMKAKALILKAEADFQVIVFD